MRLRTASGTDLWLAYGMNVHAGGTLESTEDAVRTTVLPLRERLGVTGPFGVSLRFDAETVERLAEDDRLRALLRGVLGGHDLVPFTANGFVMGRFHGGRVKEEVYRPSWSDEARARYTMRLADVMASLRGPGELVTISTLAGSWRPWDEGPRGAQDCAHNLVKVARHLHALELTSGTRVVLALEAEPRCTIETTREMISFLRGPLVEAFGRGSRATKNVGVCYDVCHQSVVHENVESAILMLQGAGIQVAKVQASCALEVPDPRDPAARTALAAFAEPTYLHQVGARDAAGGRRVSLDLPEVLEDPDRTWADHRPWRVHFHVPVFRETSVPPLMTTRPDLDAVLRLVARGDVTEHLEIETYTWDVLPESERRAGSGSDLVESLAREYEHVLQVLAAGGVRRADAE